MIDIEQLTEESEYSTLEELGKIQEVIATRINDIFDTYAEEITRLLRDLAIIPNVHMSIEHTYYDIPLTPDLEVRFDIEN